MLARVRKLLTCRAMKTAAKQDTFESFERHQPGRTPQLVNVREPKGLTLSEAIDVWHRLHSTMVGSRMARPF